MKRPNSLIDIADKIGHFDPVTKGRSYYDIYQRYFDELARPTATLLELGVYQGQSAKIFATFFEKGKIIAVDKDDRGFDFSAFANIVFECADQRDGERLAIICARHAPQGVDIVIDDAAHIGSCSLASYNAVLPLLRPGGLYIIEDWGTGYWNDWPESRALRRNSWPSWFDRGRIRSHDYGMVGFLKSLIEDVSVDIRPKRDAATSRAPQFSSMHVYGGLAVLKKIG